MDKTYIKNYKEDDQRDFEELNQLQLDFIEKFTQLPEAVDYLSQHASNLTGSYKYYQIFYGTRQNKNVTRKDRVAQKAALNSVIGGNSADIASTLVEHKLKLAHEMAILKIARELQHSDDTQTQTVARQTIAIFNKKKTVRDRLILNKRYYIRNLAKKVFFNCEVEEIESIGMVEMPDLVERFNLDETTTFASNIRLRMSHVLRRTRFDDSTDALDKNTLALKTYDTEGNAHNTEAGHNSIQIADESIDIENDCDFNSGLKIFNELVSSYPKLKRYIAEQYFMVEDEADINLIANEVGYMPQQVYSVIKEIKKDFTKAL